MKVFCIGFNKTGTTSLTRIFQNNGFLVAPENPFEKMLMNYLTNDFQSITNLIENDFSNYVFFQDIPFSLPNFYKFLYEKYPNANFILTVRNNKDDWYQSLVNSHKKLFEDISQPEKIIYLEKGWIHSVLTEAYNAPHTDPYSYTSLTRSYLKHNREVENFFSDKKNQFLKINLAQSDVVQKIENFLEVEFPNKEIPHLNKSK